MLGLVGYGSSDEDSDPEEDQTVVQMTRPKTSAAVLTPKPSSVSSSSVESPEDKPSSATTTTGLFAKLPAPKTGTVSSTSGPQTSSALNDIVVAKSGSGGPIKIAAPSLKYYTEDDSDEEAERRAKRFKGSATGTGLKGLLPKPKGLTAATAVALIPQSLTRKNANPKTSSVAKPEAKGINFFFNNDISEKTGDLVDTELHEEEFGPKPPPAVSAPTVSSDPYPVQQTPSPANQRSLEDMSYKRLIASKFGEEAPEDISIVDVDVSKHLRDSKDWLKTITEEQEDNTYKGPEASSTAKRKHQITYLALQAKQREVELKNEWARNRTTKTQSRAKYGF